jgi:rhodanese-related sulfurtransferase
MPSIDEITVQQLSRLVGLPESPRLVDLRPGDISTCARSRVLPAACNRDADAIAGWAPALRGRRVVLYCHDGGALSRGVAAWLRDEGMEAEVLAGGFEAWRASGHPVLHLEHVPEPDESGATVWVTRVRPKIVRIACPWLIRRFVDPDARFLFVPHSEVASVAERFGATPFDTGHGIWNDDGDRCTFDVMLRAFGLETEPLLRLATIVRGADTGRLDLAPQSAGLLASSLGFSRMYRDDVAQLDAAMALYDSFYRWSRDASDEAHG